VFGSREPTTRRLEPEVIAWGQRRRAEIREDRLRGDVQRLIGPHSRLLDVQAMARVEEQVANDLAGSGWEVERREFRRQNVAGAQDFGWGLPTTFAELRGTNILARKRGEVHPTEAVVVVAHYDTRRDTPGADDNTASVACLLELARVLAAQRFRKTVLLAATDLEEVLFVGARALAPELAREYRVRGVLVLETMAFVDRRPHTLKLESKPGILYRPQCKRM
jgi:acetylornithine deacetylase/succinyl-diaminopimelate desuccinylase-like protein